MIGILTFQNTTNYGAILQTYALQTKINQLGYENQVINYCCTKIQENEDPIKLFKQKSLRGIIRYFVLHKAQLRRKVKFDDFYNRYIISSKDIYYKNNIVQSNKVFDKYIVGSDQVWNMELSGHDFTFFLDFVDDKKKKHTYAASFGYRQIPCDIEKHRELLSKFSTLNIREEEGLEIIQQLTGIKGNLVLDPTLLLKMDDWNKLCKSRIVEEDYILVYLIERTNSNFSFIKKFAKEHKCKIIYLQYYIKTEPGMINIRDASPEEFLNYVKFAKCIFTGSFHGLCFSLIYNKEVFYTLAQGTGRNSRIENLVRLAGLESRLLAEGSLSDFSEIDYNMVNQRIEILANQSIACLENVLKDA